MAEVIALITMATAAAPNITAIPWCLLPTGWQQLRFRARKHDPSGLAAANKDSVARIATGHDRALAATSFGGDLEQPLVYLYRAIDCSGALVDVMLSETRDMAAAKAFFHSARIVIGLTPAPVTTDGHDSYPRAIRTTLGRHVRYRTSRYLTNGLEQDHRGIKGRYRPMRGFKCVRSAERFCRGYDERRNFLHPLPHHHQPVRARLM